MGLKGRILGTGMDINEILKGRVGGRGPQRRLASLEAGKAEG